MPRLVRLLIVLSVALLVPLQGFAAMAAGVCMAMGHHEAPMSAAHDHDAHWNGGQPHDEHRAVDQHDGGEASAHCAPCVACCAAACIAPALSLSVADLAPEAALPAQSGLPPGFVPDALDRPPLAL